MQLCQNYCALTLRKTLATTDYELAAKHLVPNRHWAYQKKCEELRRYSEYFTVTGLAANSSRPNR
jgi:tRNA A22 N-methylase